MYEPPSPRHLVPVLLRLSSLSAHGVTLLLTLACARLALAILTDDFRFEYVARYSTSASPGLPS